MIIMYVMKVYVVRKVDPEVKRAKALIRQRKYRETHKEYLRDSLRKYRAENPETVRRIREDYYDRIKYNKAAKEQEKRKDPDYLARRRASARKCAAKRRPVPMRVRDPEGWLAMKRAAQKIAVAAHAKKRNAPTEENIRRKRQNKLSNRLRARFWQALAAQGGKTGKRGKSVVDDLGMSMTDFYDYITSMFKPGMTWDDRKAWHLDHIRPVASFDLSQPSERAACFHYTNFQPLWAHENRRKSDNYEQG